NDAALSGARDSRAISCRCTLATIADRVSVANDAARSLVAGVENLPAPRRAGKRVEARSRRGFERALIPVGRATDRSASTSRSSVHLSGMFRASTRVSAFPL